MSRNLPNLCMEIRQEFVGLNITRPLKAGYRIRGEVQDIQYEGLHELCFHCGKYGHKSLTCPSRIPPNTSKGGEVNAKEASSSSVANQPPPAEKSQGKQRSEIYGEWMMVSKPRRRTSQQQKMMAVDEAAPKGKDRSQPAPIPRKFTGKINQNQGSRYSILINKDDELTEMPDFEKRHNNKDSGSSASAIMRPDRQGSVEAVITLEKNRGIKSKDSTKIKVAASDPMLMADIMPEEEAKDKKQEGQMSLNSKKIGAAEGHARREASNSIRHRPNDSTDNTICLEYDIEMEGQPTAAQTNLEEGMRRQNNRPGPENHNGPVNGRPPEHIMSEQNVDTRDPTPDRPPPLSTGRGELDGEGMEIDRRAMGDGEYAGDGSSRSY